MTDSATSTTKRLLRILLGGAVLASAWLAVDLLTHSESASAAETIDVIPIGSDPVSAIISPVIAPAAPIAAPAIETVTSLAPAVTTIVAPVVTVVAPVVEPVVTPVLSPIVERVTPFIPVVTGIVGALPQLSVSPNAGILVAGGGLILGVALAASTAPLLPAPSNGGPRDEPAAPAAPGGQSAASVAVLNSAFFAAPGSADSARSTTDGIPSSPTYGFDTTPD